MAISDPIGRGFLRVFRGVTGSGNSTPEKLSGAAAARTHLLSDGATLNQSSLIQSGTRQVKSLLFEGRRDEAEAQLLKLLSYGEISPNGQFGAEARVADVLELVRHAQAIDHGAAAKGGLDWAVELLRASPDRNHAQWMRERGTNAAPDEIERRATRHMQVLREADAVASLALVIGQEATAREALTLVRPKLQEQPNALARHLNRLKGELPKPGNEARKTSGGVSAGQHSVSLASQAAPPQKPAKVALDYGVAREQGRLEGARMGFRQPIAERKALLAQMQSGQIPFLEGLRRLKERNPQHEEALTFLEECVKAEPSRWKGKAPSFVLEDNILSRPEAVQRLLELWRYSGAPDRAAIMEQFLTSHPEYRPVEQIRQKMLSVMADLQAREPAENRLVIAPKLEEPMALLKWIGNKDSDQWVQVGEKWQWSSEHAIAAWYPAHKDAAALAKISFDYAQALTWGATITDLIETGGRTHFRNRPAKELLRAAED